ncbi:MAG: hypothetical protein AAGD32_04555 [Planctomycetota bacterium]
MHSQKKPHNIDRFFPLHRPTPIRVFRFALVKQAAIMSLEFVKHFLRHLIGLGHMRVEWLGFRFPVVLELNRTTVGNGHDDMDWQVAEASIVGSGKHLGKRPGADRYLAEQHFPVALQQVTQKLALLPGLLDGRLKALAATFVGPIPEITATAVMCDGHRANGAFALDDENGTSVNDEMIDLCNTGRPVGVGLLRIDQP